MKKSLFLFLLSITYFANSQNAQPPKLVVGIVVDQLRYDLLTRYKSNFCEGGFKRMMDKGFFSENMHFNYAPTVTGPGHASIYTGTTPAIHGIAGNHWYDRATSKSIYCAQDDSVLAVGFGSPDFKDGKMSPHNMHTSTLGDQMKLFSYGQAKVIGISLKNRGAILPAGHSANAAYWYDNKSGLWGTSSYYMRELPTWVSQFNEKKHYQTLLKDNWNLILPKSAYSSQDSVSWEELDFKKETSTLPYLIPEKNQNTAIVFTPFGNTMTNLLAIEAIKNEKLGKGKATDLLAISYSSTDIIGHGFGPYSMETEDCYYRLDRDLKILLDYLDSSQGRDNYWVFVTADHGVQDVPAFSRFNKIPAGRIDDSEIQKMISEKLNLKFGVNPWISKLMNEQIYLNLPILEKANVSKEKILQFLNSDLKIEGVAGFYDFQTIMNASLPLTIKEKLSHGFNLNRSGDICILLQPNWMSHGPKGTTHGSPFSHDTHVPFLFYGKNVKSKSSSSQYNITDIAPTISYLLGTLQPNGCIGIPIKELEYIKK